MDIIMEITIGIIAVIVLYAIVAVLNKKSYKYDRRDGKVIYNEKDEDGKELKEE